MVEHQPNYLSGVDERAPHTGQERLNCQLQTGDREHSVQGRGRDIPRAQRAICLHCGPTRHIC